MTLLLFVMLSQSPTLQLEPIPGVNPRAVLVKMRAKLCDVQNEDDYLTCLRTFKICKGKKGLGYEWLFEDVSYIPRATMGDDFSNKSWDSRWGQPNDLELARAGRSGQPFELCGGSIQLVTAGHYQTARQELAA
jgi:hypothetical protein